MLSTLCYSLLALFSLSAVAQEGVSPVSDSAPASPTQNVQVKPFYHGKEDGWFWYKDPKDAPPKPAEKAPPPSSGAPKTTGAPKKTEPFSVDWLRKNLPVLLERAIDTPSKDNVEAYLYAQRIAMDKAQEYAVQARAVVTSDPFLDENNRVPLSTFAKRSFLRDVDQQSEMAVKELASKGGLWVFTDSRCHFCSDQVNQVEALRAKYGFLVKYISVDGAPVPGVQDWVKDNGHVKLLRLKITPTIVFAVPPKDYLVISQGLMAHGQIVERLLLAAEDRKLLPEKMLARTNPYSRGVLSPADVADGASDDPKEWVTRLKEKLENRY